MYRDQQKHLQEFVGKDEKVLTPALEQILVNVAKTGLTCDRWDHLKQLISTKLAKELPQFSDFPPPPITDPQMEENTASLFIRVDKLLSEFSEPPFTLQRICELTLQPQRHYKTAKKFLFALEKLVTVSKTDTTLTLEEYEKAIENLQQQQREQERRQKENNNTSNINETEGENLESNPTSRRDLTPEEVARSAGLYHPESVEPFRVATPMDVE